MFLPRLPVMIVAALVLSGCGTGGRDFWLYPEPHLPETEEAVFAAYEGHRLLYIDDTNVAARCWGEGAGTQAYRQKNLLCRLHLDPGQHTVLVQTGLTLQGRTRLEFTALPGKVYGLKWSNCRASLYSSGRDCLLEVVEIETIPGAGG